MRQHTSAAAVADRRLARNIAVLMRTGTAVASVLLTAGAVLMPLEADLPATILLTAGCGLLVALPVARLTMMVGHFARLADRRFVGITLAVIVLVVAGGAIGLVR